MKTKIEIVSGFLGSGKTSFINSYLNTDLCVNKDILIILLETGVTSIREDLKNIKVLYLEETYMLKDSLIKEIMRKKYNKIILEFNGTSSLNIIGELFKDKDIKKNFTFYGNYFVGDSKTLRVYIKNLGEIIIPFIKSSKLIIINNLSEVDTLEEKRLINTIEEINNFAPIILSEKLSNLEKDIKKSSYFKDSYILSIIKVFLNKRKVNK